MSLHRFLLPIFGVSLLASVTHAEIPSRTKAELRKDAQLIVVGRVSASSVSIEGDANWANWIAEISVDVTSTEKGKHDGLSDTLSVRCHRWKARPRGFVGPSGHDGIPAESSKVRLWLTSTDDGTWTPLLPNGIEIIDGQRLDLENAEIVTKTPEPEEAYAATKGKERLLRRGDEWSYENGDKPVRQFLEYGRDLNWIYLTNSDSHEALRIPRLGGIVQDIIHGTDESPDRLTDLFKVERTLPAITGNDYEAFKVTMDKVGPDESVVVPDGPLVQVGPPQPAFVRVDDTWEQLDLDGNELVARYTEQYRDSQRIQLQLIVEHKWQKPHTLTILRYQDGASIVLPVGDTFEKFQLEKVYPAR